MKISTLTVVVALILTSCAAMAQPNDLQQIKQGEVRTACVDFGGNVPARVIVCPEWAMDTWAKGVMDNNIHGRPVAGTPTVDLAPTAPANRAEAWAFAVAAAEQANKKQLLSRLLQAFAMLLLFVMIVILWFRRPAWNIPAINLTISLPNGLWSGPLVSGVRGGDTMVEANASPEILVDGAKADAMGGTSNLANGEGAVAGRLQESTTIDCRESTAPFSTTIEAPQIPMPEPADEDGRILWERPHDTRDDYEDVVAVDLDDPESTKPEGWVLMAIKMQTKMSGLMFVPRTIAIFGKPKNETPADDNVSTTPGADSAGNPV